MNKFQKLVDLKGSAAQSLVVAAGRLLVCPDMGGRVFAELEGQSMHRIDLENAADPTRDFNNFGGDNFWPAPEGGWFGFNYPENEWVVQPAINSQPFDLVDYDTDTVRMRKKVALKNRAGTTVEAIMERLVEPAPIPEFFGADGLLACAAFKTTDSFEVCGIVSTDQALLASWTLEQFDASGTTVAFCLVENPEDAINFDFYAHPGERIDYHKNGFTYRVDGRSRGQIGIRKDSSPRLIGFFDVSRNLVCVRQNLSTRDALYFNIADNDQPDGPFAASDTYSIFNSDDEDGRFFELETIGGAEVKDGRLLGSELVSLTAFAILGSDRLLIPLILEHVGRKLG